MELRLLAPAYFDPAIGYWTGEPDVEALARALSAVPEDPRVQRVTEADAVLLRGPEAAVREQAHLLRQAGLEPTGLPERPWPRGSTTVTRSTDESPRSCG
jgi:hypothetical protein